MKTRIMSLVCAIALIFTLFPQIEAKALEHTQTAPLYIYSKDCPRGVYGVCSQYRWRLFREFGIQ